MHRFWPASLALALAAPLIAHAESPTDIAALRQELQMLRADQAARLQALEQRLQAAEARPAPSPAPATAPAPAQAAASGSSPGGFNPALSLILSGQYTRTSRDPAPYAIGGFALPAAAEVGPGSRGFNLGESELGLSASIDPWWRGAANLALHGDDSVSVEEAYVETTALGQGMTLKAGRFLSGVGYLNSQHAHTWDFVDSPLAYQALLGAQYGDDGVQLRWLAPTDRFIEVGLELGRGRGHPGDDAGRNGAGMKALTLHSGGDIGDSQSWRAGVSVLDARADHQGLSAPDAGGQPLDSAFSGRTRVWVADAVWKWAPGGNATRTSFKLQGEYLRSTRKGTLVLDPAGVASAGALNATQSGWYLQAVYQFMPRWRLGLRGERLDAGDSADLRAAGGLGQPDFAPRRTSLMLDYSASEFSRIRLQLARDQARQGDADNQFFIQYQMSLGAHGAHGY
jgi:hypothetical protein